jgi:argininosuccinate lyase
MTLWGGRFGEGPDDALWAFTVSAADRRLLPDDLEGSLAHAAGLVHAGILDEEDGEALRAGLEQIQAEVFRGEFAFEEGDEDVHSAVERRLFEIAGEAAGRLHTGRSRNDQIALDLRLHLRAAAASRIRQIAGLARALALRAEEAGETVVASYTHLQQAQAIPFAHHLLAHAWALVRDAERFRDALARIGVSPLGAGAGGGSRLPLTPGFVAERLGMSGVFENSLDAVSSRDVEAEYLFCCAQTMVHLSRLAEELVLWCTTEFGWAEYADRHSTGSSALPHKKNPDAAELARGKAASAVGHLAGLLAVQKGLPLSYNRDLQQDKEHLFPADDDLAGTLDVLTAMILDAALTPQPPGPWVAALDLAEALVERGLPFRDAHRAVGALVAGLAGAGLDLASVSAERLAAAHPLFRPEDLAVADPAGSVRARRSPGGGSFESVGRQLEALTGRLEALERAAGALDRTGGPGRS